MTDAPMMPDTPDAQPDSTPTPEAPSEPKRHAGLHTINLSSGEVPPPRAPEPKPAPPVAAASGESRGHEGVFTVNLASDVTPGSRPRRNRKVAAAPTLVTKTINLSTPKTDEQKAAEKAEREQAEQAKAQAKASGARGGSRGKSGKGKRGGGPSSGGGGPRSGGAPRGGNRRDDTSGNARPSSGSSLADLLDPEVLKKLRGG